MPHLSTQDQVGPELLSQGSALSLDALLKFSETLRNKCDEMSVAETLCNQSHTNFFPVPVAVLVCQEKGVRIVAAASQNENLESALSDPTLQETLASIVTRVAKEGKSDLHFLKDDAATSEPFRAVHCGPLRREHPAAAVALFLTADQRLGEAERTFFAALAEISSLAFSQVELHRAADARSAELQELLDSCAEVGAASSLDKFLERFVVRAASFLGYRASFIALVEEGVCLMRWASRDGLSRPLNVPIDSSAVRRVVETKGAFWSDEIRKEPGIDPNLLLGFRVEQLFAVPLVGSNGECFGILGLLDRSDSKVISDEDVRRAKALAAQATVALESARNLDISEQHRSRAETLVSFALDLGASVELEELVKKFTSRAMELLEARASFMALLRGSRPQPVVLQGISGERERQTVISKLGRSLEPFMSKSTTKAVAISGECFEVDLAREFGWRQVIITPLFGAGNELLALHGLVDCRRHSASDIELVQAMATHAAAALQNSQLFTRITRSSRQWAEMFDSISDLMLLHDEHQRLLRVNRSLSEKLGREPAELLGAPVRDLFALSGNTPACPFCLDLRGHEFREEFREPRTGNIYLVSSSRLRGVAEETQQVVHVLKDVTANRRAERLYRELFDNIQEGAYFSAPDGRLLEVNDALVRMLGYDSREELLNVKAQNLYVDPGHRELTARALNQFGRLRNHELALLRRDGSIIYTLENSFVVRDESGNVVEYRGVLLDITEIKHVQSQLLREHDFNTQILNHTQSLIAVVDTAGLVSYANRRCCEVAGGGEGDLVGSRLETLVLPSHRLVLRSAIQCVLEGKAVNNLELPLGRGGDPIGSFSVNLSPMRSPNGEVNSLVVVMTDITDVAMLQAKLMHAEKMAAVGQLVSGVAHEVNNPLTAILGFADLLLENPELADDVKDDLRVIVQESQRTREIVQNLLSFARQTPPEKQAVNVNQVLRRTISLRSYDLSSHDIELRQELDADLPETLGDAHQLQQVFLNILNNACDAVRDTGRHGSVVISTARVGNSIEVRFRDSGTGISNPERIFDPFYTTKEVGKGTGLGLSICYGIVREHSGEISCFNNHDSEGATFAICLPMMTVDTKAAAKSAGR
jgi:PAS domain S-box-containing protein